MKKVPFFLARFVTYTLAIIISDWLLPGIVLSGAFTAMVLALVLTLLNLVVKPLLIFLTLPMTLISFGLFLFVINASMVLLAAYLVPGFMVDGFWWALAFSIILSLCNSLLEALQKNAASRG
ncbi:MAG: phage holin family protein [Bacteroidota bacterium]|jgi:putative membrane protein